MAHGDFPIALLVSYHGSTAEAVVRSCHSGLLKDARISVDLVVSSSPSVDAIRFTDGIQAMKLGRQIKLPEWRIHVLDPLAHVDTKPVFIDEHAYGEEVLKLCKRWNIQLLCLFGWLGPLPHAVLNAYGGRILRQFCGPMDPGRRDFFAHDLVGPGVHAAVLWYQRTLSGIAGAGAEPTTEVVAQLLQDGDRGPVVGAAAVPLLATDNPTTLAERAMPIEHKLQIETIRRFSRGELAPRTRKAPLIPSRFHPTLDEAMAVGRTLYPVERHLLPK